MGCCSAKESEEQFGGGDAASPQFQGIGFGSGPPQPTASAQEEVASRRRERQREHRDAAKRKKDEAEAKNRERLARFAEAHQPTVYHTDDLTPAGPPPPPADHALIPQVIDVRTERNSPPKIPFEMDEVSVAAAATETATKAVRTVVAAEGGFGVRLGVVTFEGNLVGSRPPLEAAAATADSGTAALATRNAAPRIAKRQKNLFFMDS